MSETSEQARPRAKKPGGNSHGLLTLMAAARRTVFVGFPPPAQVPCPTPFHASGTNDPTTVMDPTARIVTPMGDLIGNLQPMPDPPFTWTYVFANPLPQGVPLAFVVRGTNALGQVEEVVVPFQAQ